MSAPADPGQAADGPGQAANAPARPWPRRLSAVFSGISTPGRLALAALCVAALAVLALLLFWQRADQVTRESARRLQQGDARAAQIEAQLHQQQELTRDLQSRSAVLEAKLTEVLGQQAQLERLYRSMAHDGIDTVLADVENALSIASQQLSVSGNVRGAIIALQDADGRLKRINQPEAIGLRRLIARDLDRLRAVPNVDVSALLIRLESISAAIDQLPMLAGMSPVSSATPPRPSGHSAESRGFSLARLAETGRDGWRALVDELRQLFRVNRIDEPDAMLLAPEQRYFVRENLRLVLLSARMALLSRSESVFRRDVERAAHWLETHYDSHDRAVVNAVATLRQLGASRFAADLPSLGDTLAAVRSARDSRDAGR